MKTIFWIGWIGLLLFEIANVYFIMPMPGSQQMNSVDAAYFMYSWRWVFRAVFGLMIIGGLLLGGWKKRWLMVIPVLIASGVIYMANFQMAADAMFKEPNTLIMADAAENDVDPQRLVIGLSLNGESKAYPIRFLGYHHQVQDSIGGKPVLITYCTVCRSGRAYEPTVMGRKEKFRLVGMDHFNAMLEDENTKSWWQQATGKAVAGTLKGQQLPELASKQLSLEQWLKLYPDSKIMQADPGFLDSYDTSLRYESGLSKSRLTGTDSLSWKDKSWVIGIRSGAEAKAYDWNQLKAARVIRDQLNNQPIALVLGSDDKTFFAFEIPFADARLSLTNDTIILNQKHFLLNGNGIDTAYSLKPVQAYQEFWHSWRQFNPDSKKY